MTIKPLKIGNVIFDPPILLAPMAGITNRAFRLLCREAGAGGVVSEFISSNAIVHNNARTEKMVRMSDAEHPVIVQIFGQWPENLAQAASFISAYKPDVIDINMGCGVPKVTRLGAGGAMMRDLKLVRDTFQAVRGATDLPVTVKMRSYWLADGPTALDVAQIAEEEGLSAVTVHPRPGKVHHNFGEADWSVIKRVKENVKIPVIGNGDIKCGADALRCFEETGCDGIMIGRAAEGNPWIFTQTSHYLRTGEELAPPTIEERAEMAIRHGELLIADKGEKIGVQEMRKHVSWYMKGFNGAPQFRAEVMKQTKWEPLIELINNFSSFFTL